MAIETERKFLVKGDFQHLAIKNEQIRQAYLSVDPSRTIRLRITGEKAFLTVKSGLPADSISRMEWELEVQPSVAEEMMKICIPGKIVKTRFYIPYGSHTYEVDVFHDKNEGLTIAEIELSEESEPFERPDWLGDEVTGNPAYYNSNLIK